LLFPLVLHAAPAWSQAAHAMSSASAPQTSEAALNALLNASFKSNESGATVKLMLEKSCGQAMGSIPIAPFGPNSFILGNGLVQIISARDAHGQVKSLSVIQNGDEHICQH
jgi:hypothetical protein